MKAILRVSVIPIHAVEHVIDNPPGDDNQVQSRFKNTPIRRPDDSKKKIRTPIRLKSPQSSTD